MTYNLREAEGREKLKAMFYDIDNFLRDSQWRDDHFWSIDELPLSEQQKECVLEWFARKILGMDMRFGADGTGKSYDPLKIDGRTAHSYVFDLTPDGGRHHDFRDLEHLEELLEAQLNKTVAYIVRDAFEPIEFRGSVKNIAEEILKDDL